MTAQEPRAHARFNASAYERWGECAGSVRRLEALPERPTSAFAQEGTDAHHVLETALKMHLAGLFITSAREAWDNSDFFHLPRNVDMCEAVQTCLDYVYAILCEHEDAEMVVEQRFDLPTKNAPGEAWGRNDVMIWVPSARTLYVIDYKHGAGIAVEAYKNKQLMFYGAGAVFAAPQAVDRVVLVIVQPRAFHAAGPIREYETNYDELLDFLCDLDDAIARALEPDAPLVAGDKQCRWCVKLGCPAVEGKALAAAGEHFKDVKDFASKQLPAVETLPLDKLAYMLEVSSLIKSWLDDAEEHATALAKQGVPIPGRKLVETQARRTWFGTPEETAAKLVELTGKTLDDVMPRKLINVTDAEKLVVKAYKDVVGGERKDANKAADMARSAMAFLTTKATSGNVTLVPLSDSRPAYSPVSAFNGITIPSLPTP